MNFLNWLEDTNYYPRIISCSDLIKLIRNIHSYPEEIEEGDLGKRLWKYPQYELKMISLSRLNLKEWDVDENTVDDFVQEIKENPNYPPIVVARTGSVIDGMHRANAVAKLGHTKVKAYLGIK